MIKRRLFPNRKSPFRFGVLRLVRVVVNIRPVLKSLLFLLGKLYEKLRKILSLCLALLRIIAAYMCLSYTARRNSENSQFQ